MMRLLALLAVVILSCLAALSLGASFLSPVKVAHLLVAHDAQDFVIWNHRLPRTLIAAAIGAALGLAGALVQSVIRNPLASPDLLGVTQGAGLALAFGLLVMQDVPVTALPLLTIFGGAAGALFLMLYNIGNFSPLRFALSGIAVSACFAGITEFLMLTHPVEINTALMSLTGSLWARGWNETPLLLPMLPLALSAAPLAKSLDLMALGDATAQSLGVPTRRVQITALSIAVALTGLSVAVVGPVGFIGLIAGHIARHLFPGKMLRSLPASAAVGATIGTAADTLGRAVAPPTEIPIGVMTAVIGAPYFLWLLYRMK